ncbi:MAG: histidinol dehydrogenase [Pseudomonadota bacterium]
MPHAVKLHRLTALSASERQTLLTRTEAADMGRYLEQVRPIIEAVRDDGDAALARFAERFDGAPLSAADIAVTGAEFDAAHASLDAATIAALEFAVDNVRRFHERQMPEPLWLEEIRPGAFAGERYTPIDAVACYVPRGKGSFPSVAVMTAIPASVAGVPVRAIVTPPGPDGRVDAATLVVARLAGIDRVYKCGGSQAVAAVAYGTESVPRCDKLVGPGSPWVVAAKRLLADRLEPGTPAGPSESIVLADAGANPRIAALDLLNESEHGPDSSAFLVTDSETLAVAVREAVLEYWQHMGEQRVEFSATVLGGDSGGIVLCDTFDEAIAFTNEYAPEHLAVLADEPMQYLDKLRHAGEILLGEHTAIAIANYVLGPNAVLPTSMKARVASPLSVFDFLKSCSLGRVTAEGYRELAAHTKRLAEYEGFEAHANAVSNLRDKAWGDG